MGDARVDGYNPPTIRDVLEILVKSLATATLRSPCMIHAYSRAVRLMRCSSSRRGPTGWSWSQRRPYQRRRWVFPHELGLKAPTEMNVQEHAAGQHRQMAGWIC
jgi:hypothetical protein